MVSIPRLTVNSTQRCFLLSSLLSHLPQCWCAPRFDLGQCQWNVSGLHPAHIVTHYAQASASDLASGMPDLKLASRLVVTIEDCYSLYQCKLSHFPGLAYNFRLQVRGSFRKIPKGGGGGGGGQMHIVSMPPPPRPSQMKPCR